MICFIIIICIALSFPSYDNVEYFVWEKYSSKIGHLFGFLRNKIWWESLHLSGAMQWVAWGCVIIVAGLLVDGVCGGMKILSELSGYVLVLGTAIVRK
jgi:hypothetical protein